MNLGFRLPGPFRVGISSKGRVNVGVTVGPFSASGGLGGGQRTNKGVFFPVALEQFVAQAQAEGFSVQVTPHTSATIERRWKAGVATVIPGRGVMLRQTMSTWQILAMIGGVVLVLLLCCGPGYYSMATSRSTS
ncbi:hypothetical protein [Micromonospora cremea]|uniref:Uncharacterized protein n=1 Tax=Micromonospora cremea TaxID=709881 RepID=A0A1N5ZXD9_9ACTN|nr:hypothetical protein [Micromonospora cremea]SIN26297.1 hypothetical protein SAMN04489832_4581 [Micromonospora cremea]